MNKKILVLGLLVCFLMSISVLNVSGGNAITNPYDWGCVVSGPYTPDYQCQIGLGERSSNCLTDCKELFIEGKIVVNRLGPTDELLVGLRPINPGGLPQPPPPQGGVIGAGWGGGGVGGSAGAGGGSPPPGGGDNPPPPPPPPPPPNGGGITASAKCGNGVVEAWAGEQCEKPGDTCRLEYVTVDGVPRTIPSICTSNCQCPTTIRIGGNENISFLSSEDVPVAETLLGDVSGNEYMIHIWSLGLMNDGDYGVCTVEYPNGDHIFRDCYWNSAASSVVIQDLELPYELSYVVYGIGGFAGTDTITLEQTYTSNDYDEYEFDAGLNTWHQFTASHSGGQTTIGGHLTLVSEIAINVDVPPWQRMIVQVAQDATTSPQPNDGKYKFVLEKPDGTKHDCISFGDVPVDSNAYTRDLFCDGIERGSNIEVYIQGQDAVTANGEIILTVQFDSLVLRAPDVEVNIPSGSEYTFNGMAYQDVTATDPSTYFEVSARDCTGCTFTRSLYVNGLSKATTLGEIHGTGVYKYNYEGEIEINAGDIVEETMSVSGAPGQYVTLKGSSYLTTNEFNKISLPAATLLPGTTQEYGPYSNCETGSYVIGDIRFNRLVELKGAACAEGYDCTGSFTVTLNNVYNGETTHSSCYYHLPATASMDLWCLNNFEANYNLLSDQVIVTANPTSGELSYNEAVVYATTCRPFTEPKTDELTCGMTITTSGTYTLTEDLVNSDPTAPCLTISGAEATIDGNGKTISSTAGGTAIVATESSLTVKDISINNFNIGIQGLNSVIIIEDDEFNIDGEEEDPGQYRFIYTVSCDTRVKGSTFDGNGAGTALSVTDGTLDLTGSTFNNLEIGLEGINVQNVEISDNTFNNVVQAVFIDPSSNIGIFNNYLQGTGFGIGINLISTTLVSLYNNIITNFETGLLMNADSTATIGPNEKYYNNLGLDASYYSGTVTLVQPVYAINVDSNGDGAADSNHGWQNPWNAFVELKINGKSVDRVKGTITNFLKDNVRVKAVDYNSDCAQAALALPREMRAQALYSCPDAGQVGGITNTDGKATIGVPSGLSLVFAGWDQDDTSIYYWTFKPITLSPGQTAKQNFHKMEVKGSYYAYAGEEMIITGGAGETLIMYSPDYVDWTFSEGNEMYYPFIFESNNEWAVDVCARVPEGYIIVEPDECITTFIAGETKAILFKVVETGSPKPNLEATIKAKSKNGPQKTIRKEIAGKQKAADNSKDKAKGKGLTGATIFDGDLNSEQLGIVVMLFLVGAVGIFYVFNKKKK